MIAPLLFAAIAAGSSRAPALHPNSFSLSELHVRGGRVELQLRCQVLSLGEVIEGFDDDLDGHAEDGEIEGNADAIADYVAAHYRLSPDAETNDEAGDASRALARVDALVVEAPLGLDPLNEVSEWVDVRLRYEAPDGAFERLGVFVDLFELTSPGHRDSAALVWNGVELGPWTFSAGANEHVFVATDEAIARGAPVFGRYARLAPRALLASYDVLLLTLLFVLASRPGRASALTTGLLFGGSIAVGLHVAPQVDLRPQHVRFLQLTVPLAVAYVALDDLLHREGRTRIVEPVVFGLVAGAREATALAPELAREESTGPALAGFSAVYVGLVAAFAMALTFVLGTRSPDADSVESGGDSASGAAAPRTLRLAVAALSLVVGGGLFAWRTFG